MYETAVFVALGSNLPGGFLSSRGLLDAALAAFPEAGLTVLKRSSWWRSVAWPDPAQPAYLNGVALVDVASTPRETLQSLREIEAAFGRRRDQANAPRTIDLDLVAFGRTVIETPDLVLPHPRAAERLFVMGPLAEIAPDWVHPVLGQTASVLAGRASVGRDARPI